MRTLILLSVHISLFAPHAASQDPKKAFDWTVGTWNGVRIDAEDGTRNPMTMVVEPILGGFGQIRRLEVLHDGGIYRGFAVQVYNRQTGMWGRRYTNESRGTFSELEGRPDGATWVWDNVTPGRTREGRVRSERPSADSWKRIMSVSEDGGQNWTTLWTDELERVQTGGGSLVVVRNLTDAFNRHDADGMMEFVTDDVRWLSLRGDSISIEVSGKVQLTKTMEEYFSGLPTVRSAIESEIVSGRYVTVGERASWMNGTKERSQTSLAVYEIQGDRIRRVWYFPAGE